MVSGGNSMSDGNPMSGQPILVYGADGAQGSPVVRRLLAAGRPVRVLVRRPERAAGWRALGAEAVVADLDDPPSLRRATDGAAAVSLHLPQGYDPATTVRQGIAAIDAAQSAGVAALLLNTSSPVPTEPTGVPAFEAKRAIVAHLRGSGVPHAVLRPTFYMGNLAGPWTAPSIVRDGVIAYPVPAHVPGAWVDAEDVAALTVAILARPDLAGSGAAYDVGGPELLDGPALAARFTAALGRPVRYQAIPIDAFAAGLDAALGAPAGTEIAKLYRWVEANPRAQVGAQEWPESLARLGVARTRLDGWIRAQDWDRAAAPSAAEPVGAGTGRVARMAG